MTGAKRPQGAGREPLVAAAPSPPTPPPAVPFRDLDVAASVAVLLDFEAAWRRSGLSSRGEKGVRARSQLGLTLPRYVQLLRRVVLEHAVLALQHDPQLTHAVAESLKRGAADRRARTTVVRKDR